MLPRQQLPRALCPGCFPGVLGSRDQHKSSAAGSLSSAAARVLCGELRGLVPASSPCLWGSLRLPGNGPGGSEGTGQWPRLFCVPRGEGMGYCCCVPLQCVPPGEPCCWQGCPGLGAGWVAGGSQARGGCAHGWGMWVYPGREGRALPMQRGACSCLPAASSGSCASSKPAPAAAFPGEQLRLSACVGVLAPHLAPLLGQVGGPFGSICWRTF